jgi:uncharacterized protein YhhL (DUF1145 family)
MGRGFVVCAVACSALALAVYAGLFEPLGVPASGAVFLLLALCLFFHGASIYLLKGGGSRTEKLETNETVAAGRRGAEPGGSMARHG